MNTFTHPNVAPEGHKWQTKDGKTVSSVVALPTYRDHKSIVGVIDGRIYQWFEDGRYLTKSQRDLDLVNAPKGGKFWVNIYEDGIIGSVFHTREQADSASAKDRIACVEIPYIEGEGLWRERTDV